MATKKVAKRGPGRPKGNGAKRGRKPKSNTHTITMSGTSSAADPVIQARALANAAEQFQATRPTATDLIAQLRPHIKGIDSVIAQCVAAGIETPITMSVAHRYEDAHNFLLLALARAP